jgi:hypothetical protein
MVIRIKNGVQTAGELPRKRLSRRIILGKNSNGCFHTGRKQPFLAVVFWQKGVKGGENFQFSGNYFPV